MKKTAGFTLIELVIVIVILGILGAVAAPKFINLQGDAYGANVKSLAGSIQSAATLANTKAILNGYDKEDSRIVTTKDFKPATAESPDAPTVTFVYGFPAASKAGIIAMLQDNGSFDKGSSYTLAPEGADDKTKVLTITPTARPVAADDKADKCQVEYTAATKDTPASVKAFTDGC